MNTVEYWKEMYSQAHEDREELFIRERDTKNEWRELKYENEQLKKEIAHLKNQHNNDKFKGIKGWVIKTFKYRFK